MADSEVHICPVCEAEFDSQEALQEHGNQEHQEHDPEEDESGPEGTGL